MSSLRQILAISGVNLRSLPARWTSAAVMAFGIATVVAVLVAFLAISEGALRAAVSGASDDHAVIRASGGASDYLGSITREEAAIVASEPGVRKDATDVPIVQPQSSVAVDVLRKSDGVPVATTLIGSGAHGWRMDSALRLVQGRMYRPGAFELVVGQGAQARFRGLDVGQQLTLRGQNWTIVGVFSDRSGMNAAALMSDADTVLAAFGRSAFQRVIVQLDGARSFDAFRQAVLRDPRLFLDVKREADDNAEQVRPVVSVLNFVAVFIGGVMALGAIASAVNAMYAAIESRSREVGTLRALGFGDAAIVCSVLAEAVVVALPGAALGVIVAMIMFSGRLVPLGGSSFAPTVTPVLIVTGVGWGLAIGLLGGLAPAIRAARMPIVAALRAT